MRGAKQNNGCSEHKGDTVKDHQEICLAAQLQKATMLNRELEAIIESSFDGIGIIAGDGTLLRVNSSYERITGLSREENGVGRNVYDLEKEGIVSNAVGLLVLQQRKPVTIKQRIKTGKEILITGSPVFDENGNIFRIVCNIRDMTELNNLKAQVEKSMNMNARYASELEKLRALQLSHDEVIVRSQRMKMVLEMAKRVARVNSNILITGESGVGKEIIAKIIHKGSERSGGPFMQINCGAIPETLLESELFGYEQGAFTGARTGGKPGIFELCNHGTLLLDEIGEMPLGVQVKLLRVLQSQEIFRIGGSKPNKVDVRIVAATNKNLEEMVKEKAFRADLFYRLNVVPITVPPLRERLEDIVPLAIHFLETFNTRYTTNKRFEPEVFRALEGYSWPGNVRELENLIERVVVTCEEQVIGVSDLPDFLHITPEEKVSVRVNEMLTLDEATELLERDLITRAMQLYGSTRKAAKALGVTHPTVIRKAQKYGLGIQE
ncbi:MAG: sigma 54-interacting transcriptional regulator [Clostridia bacterium]|nr:sigma 54-interacting transcriptional regulator [Clostridia bacterium]